MSGFLEDRHPLMATSVASTTHIQCRASGYGSCYAQRIHGLISEVSHDSLVIRHSFLNFNNGACFVGSLYAGEDPPRRISLGVTGSDLVTV